MRFEFTSNSFSLMDSAEYESHDEDLIQLCVLDSKTDFHYEKERCLDSLVSFPPERMKVLTFTHTTDIAFDVDDDGKISQESP